MSEQRAKGKGIGHVLLSVAQFLLFLAMVVSVVLLALHFLAPKSLPSAEKNTPAPTVIVETKDQTKDQKKDVKKDVIIHASEPIVLKVPATQEHTPATTAPAAEKSPVIQEHMSMTTAIPQATQAPVVVQEDSGATTIRPLTNSASPAKSTAP